MSKKAMVIPTEILLKREFQGFLSADSYDYLSIINNPENQKFLDRYETSIVQQVPLEEDPSFQQIIPYILVVHNEKIFVYERAPRGVNTEERLASKLSIGVGGHIEPIDDDEDLILSSLKREIQEELGYYEHLDISHKGYINLIESKVDLVHFGLVFIAKIREHNFRFDNSEIVHGSFKTLEEIKTPEIYNRLEAWSKIIIDNIHSIL